MKRKTEMIIGKGILFGETVVTVTIKGHQIQRKRG